MRRRSSRTAVFLLLRVVFAAISAHAQGTWTLVASPNTPRFSLQALRLLDGSVLIISKSGGGSCTMNAERYANGAWSAAGSLPNGTCPTGPMTLLADGRVLVAGNSSAFVFDPITMTWTNIAPMQTPRTNHSATLSSNGKVMVAGGISVSNSQPLSSVEILDPETLTWSSGPSMPVPASLPTATLLPNGNVLVLEGSSTNALLFDPAFSTWRNTAATANVHGMAGGGFNPDGGDALRFLPDGQVLIAGGSQSAAEIYNIGIERWLPAGGITPRANSPVISLSNGNVVIPGGRSPGLPLRPPNNSVSLYDVVAGSWSLAQPMNKARELFPGVLLDDGRVLVVGGESGGSAEVYDPAVSNPSPVLSGIKPNNVGSDITSSVLLSGSNFTPNSIVFAGTVRLVTLYMGSTQLMAFLPRTIVTAGANLQVRVTNPGPGGGVSGSQLVNVTPANPVPTASEVTPSSLARVSTADTLILVTGTNFLSSSVVYYNSKPLQTRFFSSTMLSAVIPAAQVSSS